VGFSGRGGVKKKPAKKKKKNNNNNNKQRTGNETNTHQTKNINFN
jgi:hypothetical protein